MLTLCGQAPRFFYSPLKTTVVLRSGNDGGHLVFLFSPDVCIFAFCRPLYFFGLDNMTILYNWSWCSGQYSSNYWMTFIATILDSCLMCCWNILLGWKAYRYLVSIIHQFWSYRILIDLSIYWSTYLPIKLFYLLIWNLVFFKCCTNLLTISRKYLLSCFKCYVLTYYIRYLHRIGNACILSYWLNVHFYGFDNMQTPLLNLDLLISNQ